jgi:hypothetical protein
MSARKCLHRPWPGTAYTLEEQGETLGVSLYTIPEIWNMRGRMNHTVALAESEAGNRSGTTRGVTPWLSLGCGYRRQANHTKGDLYDLCWDYDRVYSWQMGVEVNVPWYSTESRVEPAMGGEVMSTPPVSFVWRITNEIYRGA